MCELLVRVVDKDGGTRRGEVIALQQDGWVWGREECRNPEWRIFKLPGVSVEDVSVLIGAEPAYESTGPDDPAPPRNLRNCTLDLSALALSDDRTNPLMKLSVDAAGLLALKVAD